MMIKDVNVSASGIANQIPHTFRIKGKPNIHIIMNTNPRKTVTVMARACLFYTLKISYGNNIYGKKYES